MRVKDVGRVEISANTYALRSLLNNKEAAAIAEKTAASLVASLLHLPARFVVTPKGLSSSADHLLTFRRHLQWALLLITAVLAGWVAAQKPDRLVTMDQDGTVAHAFPGAAALGGAALRRSGPRSGRRLCASCQPPPRW